MALYRIVDEFPYLDREDEYPGLTLDEATAKMEDLTGVGADVILADVQEACTRCERRPGFIEVTSHGDDWRWIECPSCHGSKIVGEWDWEDIETGREVTLRPEVS